MIELFDAKSSIEELLEQLPNIEKECTDLALDSLKECACKDKYVYQAYKRLHYDAALKHIFRQYICIINQDDRKIEKALKEHGGE
jgi:hypothetical protein